MKNWTGRRNRLPHPVCKPLDSKEGGADGFVCRARKPIFHSFSAQSQRGDGLASKPVPALTLGAIWKSSRRAMKTMDSSTSTSMRHGVDDVVHANADSQRG